jgi:hypothetical protein
MHGVTAARDIASGTFKDFAREQGDALGPAGISAVEAVLQEHLAKVLAKDNCADSFAGGILNKIGPPTRPDPSSPLRT